MHFLLTYAKLGKEGIFESDPHKWQPQKDEFTSENKNNGHILFYL